MKKSLFLTLAAIVCMAFGMNTSTFAANSCSAEGGFLAGGCDANCSVGQSAWCHAGGFLSGAKCGCAPQDPEPTDHRSPGSVDPNILADARDFVIYANNYATSNMSDLASKSAAVISVYDLNGTDADFQTAEDQWLVSYGNLTATEKSDCESWASARGY